MPQGFYQANNGNGGGGPIYGDHQQAPQPQPIPVQVVMPPGSAPHPIIASWIPQFPQLASTVDRYAKTFPWYLWLTLGIVGMWYAQKRGLWKEIAMKLGTKG